MITFIDFSDIETFILTKHEIDLKFAAQDSDYEKMSLEEFFEWIGTPSNIFFRKIEGEIESVTFIIKVVDDNKYVFYTGENKNIVDDFIKLLKNTDGEIPDEEISADEVLGAQNLKYFLINGVWRKAF